MADNRQFADHVELGGANVYFKEEPTTGTTMPNTSYFKTEDVDGKPVKISRDNIMGIVKECLGTILNGGSDQTTVTKVPTLNGNTLGASAVSTLASALGEQIVTIPANSDLNTYTTEGRYRHKSNDTASTISNTPIAVAFILFVFPGISDNRKVQLLIPLNGNQVYIRCMGSSAWNDWYYYNGTINPPTE